MKIFLTGAAGQIGTDLIRTLRSRGHTLVATDIRNPESGPVLPGKDLVWHELDVTNGSEVSRLIGEARPDAVFHLAAILSARGEANPQRTYLINELGTFHVFEACREHAVKQLLFTSSIAAYGPGLPDPTPEEVPLHPTTIYGVTKVGGELLAEYYHERFDLDVRGVRFPGLISAVMPGGGTSDYSLYMYTEGIAKGHYEAFCRADTRIPLMYMPDGVRALIELANTPRERLRRRIYNVAAFSPTAAQIAESVTRAVGNVSITFAPDPLRQAILDSWPRSLDDRAAREDWGWKPAFDLEAMTADLVPRLRDLLSRERVTDQAASQ